MKTIYFVRHGLTQANIDQVYSGSVDNSPLTSTGKRQAKAAGKSLKNKPIELVVASPMKRTTQTAHIISEQINYPKDKIIFNDLLVERHFGYWEGRPHTVRVQEEEQGIERDTGETLEELHVRVLKALEWISELDAEVILIVSHGAFGRMVRVVDRKLLWNDFHEVDSFGNCEVDEFTI